MTTIDPSHRFAAVLGGGAAALRQTAQRADARLRSAAPGEAGKPELSALVALRVRSIATDDPQRRRKALRVFLESALVQEFGAQASTDPLFQQMVDAVQAQMSADPELGASCEKLLDLLLAQKP